MSDDSEELFLIEILIESLNFSQLTPIKKQLVIVCHFGNFATIEIRPDAVGVVETGKEKTDKKHINFNCGKSYLFPCKADDLIQAMTNCPMQFIISSKQSTTPIAQTTVVWSPEFIEMVESSKESAGAYVDPVFLKNNFRLDDTYGKIVGDIDVFLRLSCFGHSVQTNIQMLPGDAKDGAPGARQFLFKSTTHATTFQCQKYGLGTSQEMLPVGPIYHVASGNDINVKPLEHVYSENAAEKGSFIGSTFDLAFITNIPKLTQSQISYISTATGFFDIMSLRMRPDEKKYLDIPCIFDDTKSIDKSLKSINKSPEPSTGTVSVTTSPTPSMDNLTVENINRLLCKNPHCPAAKKFKEFGIGPLATGKGLGTVYAGPINPPKMYGMSHCNGRFENYGPYGVFTRPKRIDEPFKPKDDLTRESLGSCLSTCTCVNAKKKEQPSSGDNPLRLTGGAPGAKDEFPQPIAACKDLMEGFDRVLEAYKRALGPCGQVTCPFAPNIVGEECKKLCIGIVETDTCPVTDNLEEALTCTGPPDGKEDTLSACGMLSCPYNRFNIGTPTENQFVASQMKPACRDPHCPYTLQKLGVEVEDFDLDVRDLPKTCGFPKCPYNPAPDLPPIHWECPEPLPKGLCKNPQCPYLPKELKSLARPKSPCGSPHCAFKQPPPCSVPGCPFEPPTPCPYTPVCDGQPPCPNQPSCPATPKCPYAPACPYPNTCPAAKPCPFTTQNPAQMCPFGDMVRPPINPETGSCSSPNCPLGPPPEPMPNPNLPCPLGEACPLANPCTMMMCPYANPCGMPPCLQANPCGMPPCPYATCPPIVCPLGQTAVVCPFKPCPLDPSYITQRPPSPIGPQKQSSLHEPGKDVDNCDFIKPKPAICEPDTCPDNLTPEQLQAKGKNKDKPEDVCCEDDVSCTSQTCLVQGKGGTLYCGQCAVVGKTSGKASKKGEKGKKDKEGKKEEDQKVGGVAVADTTMSERQTKSTPVIPDKNKKTTTPTSLSDNPVSAAPKQAKKKKKRSMFVYGIGDQYPGVKIGHRDCVMPGYNIPSNMGWLWNIFTPCMSLRPRRGWKPGAIGRTIAERIRQHREAHGLEMLNPLNPRPSKTKKRGKSKGKYSAYTTSSDETVAPKPTLQIKKRDGAYWITMNPLKDPKTLEDNENPYMDCTPMQFKITKNKEKVMVKNENDDDFKTCYCGDMEEESLSESSDSELDIEFTPPAGIIHPEKLKKKKNVVHMDTQYNKNDFEEKVGKKDKEEKKGKGKGKKGKKGKKGNGDGNEEAGNDGKADKKGEEKGKDKGKGKGKKKK